MNWPFVSREAYEERGRLVAQLRADLAAAEARIDKLEDALTPVMPAEPPALVPAAKPRDIVAEKIREEAAGDPKVAAHFWKNIVGPARREKKTDEEIVGMIGWTEGDIAIGEAA